MRKPKETCGSRPRGLLNGLGAVATVAAAIAVLILINIPQGSTKLNNSYLTANSSTCQQSSISVNCPFTVTGSFTVPPNGSQDTYNQATGACNEAILSFDRRLGSSAAGAMQNLFGSPDGATLLMHFLNGPWDLKNPYDFGPGTEASRELPSNSNFKSLENVVLGEIQNEVSQGASKVDLTMFLKNLHASSPAVVPTYLNSPSDLYWAFRGTQGITISGSGSLVNGVIIGTLKYTILDSYGFTVADANNLPFGSGLAMRYLQTNCGYPHNKKGAHWFPDSITLTEAFSRPAN